MQNRDLVLEDKLDAPLPPQGKNYLLGIAINAYQHCTPLNNAVRDVEAFIELLCTRYNFERENVSFIKDAEATKRKIEGALDRLIDLVTPQDNLIIYFSGHGRQHPRRGGFWIPVTAGTNDDDWPDYLSNGLVKDYLGKIKSHHTFLIADACFAGTFVVEASKNVAGRVDTQASRWVLTSGKTEIVSDGKPGGHSPFATALLHELRKAQTHLGVMELCAAVQLKVAQEAEQTPVGAQLAIPGNENGQMVLYLREDEEQVWASALATDSLSAYSNYYDQYPQGKYSETALDKIAECEERDEWKHVRKDRLADLLRYIRQNPRSPYLSEAQGLVNALKAGIPTPMNEPEAPRLKPEVPTSNLETPALLIPEHLVFVKGGTFEMGDVLGDQERDNETVHTVTLSDFMIGKYAVTFAEYDAFCKATGRELPDDEGWGRGQRPVINVNWYDAIEYCNWRSAEESLAQVYTVTGQTIAPNWQANGYRLPTEAEWEYAARGGCQKVRFGNGADIADPKEINFDGSKDYKKPYSVAGEYRQKTVPIGSLKCPNALGLHEMSGNVREWCWDRFGPDYYHDSPGLDPKGPDAGKYRVLRGGSWDDDPNYCRAAIRFNGNPDYLNNDIGLRLVRH
jgi:formylglycine-generating enzyme required for sulfatase activity